jgi:5-methylcytosine-specific restriction endonuclease McrA
MINKICNRCLRNLPIDDFCKDKRLKSGVGSRCKECRRKVFSDYMQTDKGKAAMKKYRSTEKGKAAVRRTWRSIKYKIARARFNASEKGILCAKRNHESEKAIAKAKEWQMSERGRELTRRVQNSAKAKLRAMRYKRSAIGKEKDRIYAQSENGKAAKARAGHKRRAALRAIKSSLTLEEWNDIKLKHKNRCIYCGEIKPLTRDCIIPVSKGGYYTKDNVVPACRSCNARKGDRPVLLQLLVEASVVNSNL